MSAKFCVLHLPCKCDPRRLLSPVPTLRTCICFCEGACESQNDKNQCAGQTCTDKGSRGWLPLQHCLFQAMILMRFMWLVSVSTAQPTDSLRVPILGQVDTIIYLLVVDCWLICFFRIGHGNPASGRLLAENCPASPEWKPQMLSSARLFAEESRF